MLQPCQCGHPDGDKPHSIRDPKSGRRKRCPHYQTRRRGVRHPVEETVEERWGEGIIRRRKR